MLFLQQNVDFKYILMQNLSSLLIIFHVASSVLLHVCHMNSNRQFILHLLTQEFYLHGQDLNWMGLVMDAVWEQNSAFPEH